MIEKFGYIKKSELEKHGYVSKDGIFDYLMKNPLSEEQLLQLYAKTMKEIFGENIDKEHEENMFKQLSAVDGFSDFLRSTLTRDLQRYFAATTPLEQLQIKGAYSRTLYFRSNLNKKDKPAPKLDNKRYAR
jgi:hypothetical protein